MDYCQYWDDANGSIVKIYEGTSATYFAYGTNQLVTQITPPATAGQPWKFAYDGQLSRRKIVKGALGASYYLWNGMNQLEERNSAGTLTARYAHGEPIVRGVGSVVEVQRITATSTYFQYLVMDHQGSVAKVTDANQNIQIAYVNDAFGRQIVAPGGANPNVPNDLVFQSNWITANIGTKRFGISPSRVYDFETGRFLQRDMLPAESKLFNNSTGNGAGIYGKTDFENILGSYNPFFQPKTLYSAAFVPNSIDPSGNFFGWDTLVAAAAGAVVGAIIGGIAGAISDNPSQTFWTGAAAGAVNGAVTAAAISVGVPPAAAGFLGGAAAGYVTNAINGVDQTSGQGLATTLVSAVGGAVGAGLVGTNPITSLDSLGSALGAAVSTGIATELGINVPSKAIDNASDIFKKQQEQLKQADPGNQPPDPGNQPPDPGNPPPDPGNPPPNTNPQPQTNPPDSADNQNGNNGDSDNGDPDNGDPESCPLAQGSQNPPETIL